MSTRNNAGVMLTTTLADIYTAPTGGAMISLIQVANTHAENEVDVTVVWSNASAGDLEIPFCSNSPVAVGDGLSVQAGGMILKPGDKIRARASAASNAAITVAVLEG